MGKCLQYDESNKLCRHSKSKCGNWRSGRKCSSCGEYKEPKRHNYLKSEERHI